MKTETHMLGNFNELVFEHRHKGYGAYVIRKSYNSALTKSLFVTVLLFGIFAFGAGAFSKKVMPAVKDVSITDRDTLISTFVTLKQPVIEPKIEPKPKEKTAAISDNKNYKAVDTHVDDVPKPSETTETHTNGDLHGKPVDSIPSTPLNALPTPVKDDNKIIDIADEMPEFIGDMFRFLRDNLRYPSIAKEAATQGTVYLSFVVEKDGTVDNVATLRGIGDGCTEEATRVVKLMPKWKPGKNHGQLVRVKFNLPVHFTLK